MLKRTIVVFAFSVALVGAPLDTAAAHAKDNGGDGRRTVECKDHEYGPIEIDANIFVPAGAFCDLHGTHVTGDATLAPSSDPNKPTGLLLDASVNQPHHGARLDGTVRAKMNASFAAFDNSVVGGDVLCNKCENADLNGSTVHGDLVANGLTQGAFDENAHIDGTFSIRNSTDGGFGFKIVSNSVGDNLVFTNNTGASNISNNTIESTLACKGNVPQPTGAGNTAQHKAGQCALL